jgi:hypothetical protein
MTQSSQRVEHATLPGRFKFLNGWQFDNLLEAQVLIEDWRID